MKDGGPAFPQEVRYVTPGPGTQTGSYGPCGGMTLRDYFAAKAMQAYLSRDIPHEMIARGKGSTAIYAGWFYAWADAMLAERDKSASTA